MITVRRLSGLGVSLATFVLVGACDPLPTSPSGPYTLSGVVTQMTSSGKVPIRGVLVEESRNHREAYTDDSGRFKFPSLPAGVTTVQTTMLRFESTTQSVTISGDTMVDVELVPREQFTLSGFVTEETSAGQVPVAGVLVQAIVCPPQPRRSNFAVEVETDVNGFYSISGMCDGVTTLSAEKPGYELPPASGKPCGGEGPYCRWVTIAGNTRFNFQLGRQ